MIGKKAEGNVSSTVMKLILVVLVIVIGFFVISYLLGNNVTSIFPDFTPDEIPVRYDGREKLLYPGMIVYNVVGREADIYFHYIIGNDNFKEGWYWQVAEDETSVIPLIFTDIEIDIGDRFIGWVSVGNQQASFDKLSDNNRNAVKSLVGKSAEDGLHSIVQRVVDNDEGNWIDHVRLDVAIGREDNKYKDSFKAKDGILKDVNGLIIKLNQLSRGVLNERK